MMTVETNLRLAKKRRAQVALKIRLQFVDGSEETFLQAGVVASKSILQQINPLNLFNQTRIVLADDYSKSVFVCSQINRVDFSFGGSGFSHIPDDHVDLVELTEADFHKYVPLHNPALLDKRVQTRRVGDLQVSFHKLKMRGGSQVYLMKETLVKLPAERMSYMQRFLAKGTLGIRLQCGGEGFLNLANLIGYTVYPGVAEVPADTWMAQSCSIYETTH
jgi:hypothetical protein